MSARAFWLCHHSYFRNLKTDHIHFGGHKHRNTRFLTYYILHKLGSSEHFAFPAHPLKKIKNVSVQQGQ